MLEISTVDGFAEITDTLADMITFLANEPSVGLFYVQQHTHNAVPNLVNLNNNVVKKSRELTLHTEDLEDSVTMTRSMKEFGFLIADEMIREIKCSLTVVATNRPKKGLITTSSPGSSLGIGRSTSWGPSTWSLMTTSDIEPQDGNYLSNVFRSARQRASSFGWPQLEPIRGAKGDELSSSRNLASLSSATDATSSSTVSNTSVDEFPSPSRRDEERRDLPVNRSLSHDQLMSLSSNYEEFRAKKEAKFEEWLEGKGDQQGSSE